MMANVNVERRQPNSGNTMDMQHSSDSDSDTKSDASKSQHQQQQQQQPPSHREREFDTYGSSEDDNIDENIDPRSKRKTMAASAARDSRHSSSDEQTSELDTERSDDRPSYHSGRNQGRESPNSPPTGAPPTGANQRSSRSPSPPSTDEQETRPGLPSVEDDSHKQQQRDRNEQVTTNDDYELTDDQRQAMTEQEQMKLDIGYTDGVEEDPPEYDVRERVRKLNEELANDPTPEEDERSRSIKFKEDPVDLVVSPPEYSGEDDDEQNARKAKDGQEGEGAATTNGKAHARPKSGTQRQSGNNTDVNGTEKYSSDDDSVDHDDGQTKKKKKHKNAKSEDVLVERNGKFELVSRNELTAEEKAMYCKSSDDSSSASGDDAEVRKEPHPPAEPRPASANNSSRKSRTTTRRAQSAGQPGKSNHSEGDFNYSSPYGMTEDQKKKSAEENKEKRKKDKQEEMKKKEKDDEQRKINNECFNVWLRQKREASSERRKQKRQEENEDDKGKQNGSKDGEKKKEIMSFKDWESGKRKQKKDENETDERQRREITEGWYVRSKDECDKAFRKWLKKKRKEAERYEQEEKQKARVYRLLARRSRKSQHLATAITQSQTFRYVDYYGYRF